MTLQRSYMQLTVTENRLFTSQNDIATFIYAINSDRKSVRLAQVVEQWTGNPEVGCSSPQSNPLIFGCVRNSY